MNKILMITNGKSDLSELIQKSCPNVTEISYNEKSFFPDDYDALCVLGGNCDGRPTLSAPLRICVEKMRTSGKPVFTEFITSISSAYINVVKNTTHHRMIFSDRDFKVDGLTEGDVLDGHKNECINYVFIPPSSYPILTYHDYVCAHSHIEMDEQTYRRGLCAMWKEDNLIACGFRLCNFRKARLAPRRSFEALITAIIRFIAGENIDVKFEEPVCKYEKTDVKSVSGIEDAVERGLEWFKNADLLKENGKGGVLEGFFHLIDAKDGVQERLYTVRNDCNGETAGAFMLHSLLTGNEDSKEIAENIYDFCFNYLQVKDGENKGMFRWTESAWEACYQDDVARVLIGALLHQHFDGTVPHFDEICDGLDFLIETTGEDGLRVARTDLSTLTPSRREEIKQAGKGTPCAHYNAYYHAALLLAYRTGGNKRYLEVAEKGLSSIMALYPNTVRETSETEENCRLLLGLSILYELTGKKEHYEWVCKVCDYLDEHRAECGAVPEWDTDYLAACSRNHTGECALLANNGDPVVDLLYSNNWLPLGYAYAYLATGEERFFDGWKKIASFLLSCQIKSDDKLLDGAWTRAFDIENWEAHGVPHDVGWAPCCIESGCTVGEILIGLQFMQQVEKIKNK